MVVKILGSALFWSASAFSTVVGVGAVNPLEVIRVPVTTIVVTSDGFASLSAAVESAGDGTLVLPPALCA
jgi:hypothetical protein